MVALRDCYCPEHDGDLMSPEPMHDLDPPRRRTKARRAVHNVWHLKPADFERKHFLLIALVPVISSVGGVVLGHWLFGR